MCKLDRGAPLRGQASPLCGGVGEHCFLRTGARPPGGRWGRSGQGIGDATISGTRLGYGSPAQQALILQSRCVGQGSYLGPQPPTGCRPWQIAPPRPQSLIFLGEAQSPGGRYEETGVLGESHLAFSTGAQNCPRRHAQPHAEQLLLSSGQSKPPPLLYTCAPTHLHPAQSEHSQDDTNAHTRTHLGTGAHTQIHALKGIHKHLAHTRERAFFDIHTNHLLVSKDSNFQSQGFKMHLEPSFSECNPASSSSNLAGTLLSPQANLLE